MRPPDLPNPPTPETLRSLCRGLGYTVCDVARKTGLSYSHLSEVHRGNRNPGLRVARALADLYGLTVAQLCDMTPEQAWEHVKRGPAPQQAPSTSHANQAGRL